MGTTNFDVVDAGGGFKVNGTTVINSTGEITAQIKDTLAQGSIYVGGADNLTSEVVAKTSGQILVGSGTTLASVAVSGDATLAANGALTIANDAVSYAKIQNVTAADRLLGRSTAGAGNVEEITVAGDISQSGSTFTIANGAVTNAKVQDSAGVGGLFVHKGAVVVYDFAVDGGAQGAIPLTGSPTIPDNAVCLNITYDVLTTFTSATDAATVTLGFAVDGNLLAATAISDVGNFWDQGAHGPEGISAVKLSAARTLQLVVAGGEDLTAGKAVFYVEYWISQ